MPQTRAGRQALEILKEAIAVPTVEGRGQVPVLAEKLKARLVAGGFPEADVAFVPLGETGYLTARYRGRDAGAKPYVILPHMDVVEAKPEDWERDPFTPVVEDGYVFGRGATDDKGDMSIVIAALIDLKRQGWTPARDIVLVITGDEETAMATTAAAAEAFKDAALVLNADGGGGSLDTEGNPVIYGIQAAEKTYADFELTMTDPGGHSSRPTGSNAIRDMGKALVTIAEYKFPNAISPITKGYLEGSAAKESDEKRAAAMRAYAKTQAPEAADVLAGYKDLIGIVRTTCVPTMVNGGHARNALPQSVTANVNCRIFPGTTRAAVKAKLEELVANPRIAIAFRDNGTLESIASPLDPKVTAAVEKAVHQRVPGMAVVPVMSAGATDSMHFRARGVPAYGVSSIFLRSEDNFNHGLNERMPLANLDPGVKHWQTLLKALAD